MRPPPRHPHLVDAACTIYGLVIRTYPTQFRRDFGHELAITFRNRVEDVLDRGPFLHGLAFALHVGCDWLRTWSAWTTEREAHDLASLLGLREGYAALGYIDRTRVDVTFAAAGFVVACAGYIYFVLLPYTLT